MKELFHEVRRLRPDSRLLVLTGTPERAIQSAEEAAGTVVMSVSPDAVPRFLACADVGLAYRSTSYSMQGIAPIKLGEYLLCGLPVIGTAAVGDTRAVVEEGLFFDEAAGTKAAAQWLVGEVLPNRDIYREKARKAGKTEFSLCRSIQDYSRALEQLRLPVAP
jgi:glycosyltransferase involved in cell wall biosynthesis